MKELKKVFNYNKKMYENPRTRAAVILGIYFVFFVFLFILMKAPNPNSDINNDKIINYTNISENYNYTYSVEIGKNDITDKYMFTGTNDNGNITEKVELYNNVSKKYEEIFDYEDINPKFIDLNTVISYVNDIKEEFTTEYKDGTIQKNYLVELNTIDNNINQSGTVEINVYEKDLFITKIIIDGTNFDSKSNENVTNSKYILEYSKINKDTIKE